MEKRCCVYWIHRKDDTDTKTQGYIGITENFEGRMWTHYKHPSSKIMEHVLKKYDDLVNEIIFEGTREECLLMEKELRPTNYVGWNTIPGGDAPPKITSLDNFEQTKKKISETLRKKGINPYSEKTHSIEAIEKRKLAAKEGKRIWVYNPLTNESMQIRTGFGEVVPENWLLGRKQTKKAPTKQRGKDYICNKKEWVVIDPTGKEYQVLSLKTWCRENGINFWEVYNQKNGWKTEKVG